MNFSVLLLGVHVLRQNISISLKSTVIMLRYQPANEVDEDMQINSDLAPVICIWCVPSYYHLLDLQHNMM